MPDTAIIGCRGTIGNLISGSFQEAELYHSENIETIQDRSFDLVICAAPTGNRRWANLNANHDHINVLKLIGCIDRVCIGCFVLIGTIDTVIPESTPYGQNRKTLETFVKQRYPRNHVIRLGSLIHQSIKKNVLHDLKYQCHLDSVNPSTALQWSILDDLVPCIQNAIGGDSSDQCMISEPVSVGDIVDEFFPDLKSKIGSDPAPAMSYNIMPYRYNREDIFHAIRSYLS